MRITRTAVLAALALAIVAGSSTVPLAGQTGAPPPLPPVEQRIERPAQEPTIQIRPVGLSWQDQYYIYRPVIRIGQDYTLKVTETVREVRAGLADVRIDGHVEGDVVVVLGSATLGPGAVIDRSLVVIGGNVVVEAGAVIGRDFVVLGGTADMPPDFSPRGDHVIIGTPFIGQSLERLVPWITHGLLWGRLIVPSLPWIWTIVGIVFVVGLVLNLLFDRQVAAGAATVARKPLSSFFVGLLVLVMAGPVLAIMAATIIGLAVVPFAIAGLVVAGVLGRVSIARAIGLGVFKGEEPESRVAGVRGYLIGFAVLVVAYALPVIGILTWALVGVFGLGAMTMALFASYRREHPPSPKTAPPVPTPPVAAEPAAPQTSYAAPVGPPAPPPDMPSASTAYAAPAAAGMPVSGSAPPPLRAPAAASAGDWSLYPRASFLDRLAALALDCVLVGVAGAVLRFAPHGGPGPFIPILLVYHIAFWTWRGTTLGGIVVGLRVVRTTGEDLRFSDALVRGLGSLFSLAAIGIGYFWILFDAERQSWHDKIAGTLVVKVPRELVMA
jgi:uncharacterized RDD family membrane protein YckC